MGALPDAWMLAEAGRSRSSNAEARVAVIVALGVERGCVGQVGARTLLTQSGPGAVRAAAAAERMLAAGAGALVSFGLAGGLAADVAPGRLLLPRRVFTAERRFDIDGGWHARLATVLTELGFDDRPLLAADEVLSTPAAKHAAAALGAAGVDLESGAIAAAAMAASVPFAVVRAVADGPSDRLPPGVATWVDANGEARLGPVLAAALRPGRWPSLTLLGRRYRAARRTLEEAARRLAPADFMLA